jgi:hypothetical protein
MTALRALAQEKIREIYKFLGKEVHFLTKMSTLFPKANQGPLRFSVVSHFFPLLAEKLF